MKAPANCHMTKEKESMRESILAVRRIIGTFRLDPGDHWLRFKDVMENSTGKLNEFNQDYLEIVPTSVINDPTSDIAFWFSMIPLTSPIVMMARIPYDIPTWEILLSLGILTGTFIAAVWFAGKIYRVGILVHGSKPSFKELWKWMRYN